MGLVLIRRKEKVRKCLLTPGGIGAMISIDPGLNGTGWALWDRAKAEKLVRPFASGAIPKTNNEESLSNRAAWICTALDMICKKNQVCELCIEQAQFMEGGKGLAAARDGDLVTLSILTGMIVGNMWRIRDGVTSTYGWSTHLIPVSKWKGNLSKDKCEYRINKILPKWENQSGTTHEADAVGIGLYAKGFFDGH